MDAVAAGEPVADVAADPVPGDASAFAGWVQPHLTVLGMLARREVGTADADDLVQDALVRAWRRRKTFDPARGAARSWLIAILLDQARRRRVRRRYAPPDPLLDAPHSPDTRLDVERALRELPRRQREVVALYYLADLPVAEVALVLGIGAGTVKTYLAQARDALRTALELA